MRQQLLCDSLSTLIRVYTHSPLRALPSGGCGSHSLGPISVCVHKTTQYYSVCTCAGPKKNYIISFHLKWGGEKSPLLTQVEIEL